MDPTRTLTVDPYLVSRAAAPALSATAPDTAAAQLSRTYKVATLAFFVLAAVDTCVPTTYVSGNWWLVMLLIWLMPWPARQFDTTRAVQMSWDTLHQLTTLAVFAWVYFRANTALLEPALHWTIPGLEGKLRALNFALQDVAVGTTTAALLAWPLRRAFTRDAVLAALVVAAPWFLLTCSHTVFDVMRWHDKPMANAIFLFEATFPALLLMQACEILERQRVNANTRAAIHARPTLTRLGALFDRCPHWFAPFIIQLVLVLTMLEVGARAYCDSLPDPTPAVTSMVAAILPLCALILTAATVHHFRKQRIENQHASWWPRLKDTLNAAFAVTMLGLLWARVLVIEAPLAEYYGKDALAAIPGPAWTIDYDAPKKVLRLSGAYEYGIASAFAAELKMHADARAVELDSPGGLVSEGMAIASLIESRGLSTLVTTECASACTLAFIAGKERTLLEDAALGFHSISTPIVSIDANGHYENFLRLHGVDPAFIKRATKVPHHDMWYPTNDTLLAAHVVTALK